MKPLPSRRDGRETRARLLEIAQQTFEERGYHRASVAEICRRAAVANGTFYRYFHDKDEVFLHLAERLGEELERVLAAALQRGGTVEDRLHRALAAFYAYVGEHRAMYQIFREAEFVRLELPVRVYHRLARRLEEHLFSPDDQTTAAARAAIPFALLGGAYMLGTRYIIWENRPVPAEVIAATVDFATRGLSTDAPLAPVPWPSLAPDPSEDAGFERDGAVRDETAGERTRRRLLAAAQQCFGELGFFHAQIADITRLAGVAQGTFYVHFPGKVEILRELVHDINRRLRRHVRQATAGAADRRHVEVLGLAAFLQWLHGRGSIYRIVREAEFVDEDVGRWYYTRLAEPYGPALAAAVEAGTVRPLASEPLAYALLGIGHISGLRWVLWPGAAPDAGSDTVRVELPDVVRALAAFLLYGVEGVRRGAAVPFLSAPR
ncbi:MAG TPA: TetR/AcrR family transcriptional regulator [Limnochordales bacterium]